MWCFRKTALTQFFALGLIVLLMCSCTVTFNDPNDSRASWSFDDSSEYSFDSQFISVESGSASLLSFSDKNDSQSDFDDGTYTSTYHDGTYLTLKDGTYGSLDSSWVTNYSNLVTYWALDGDLTDSIGSLDGTARGTTSSSVSKVGNFSRFFDGSDDVVYFANHSTFGPGASDVTISLWFKTSTTNLPTRGWLYGDNGSDTDNLIACYMNSVETLSCLFQDASVNFVQYTTVTTYGDREWHHVVWTKSGTTGTMYVDGAYVGDDTDGSLGSITTNDGLPPCIGGRPNTCQATITEEFWGWIDDVAIWDTAFTLTDVQELYNRQSVKYANDTSFDSSWVPQSGSFSGHWTMDGNSLDSQGSNDGSESGGTIFVETGQVGTLAASFDGVAGSNIDFGDVLDVGTQDWSVSVWFRPTDATTGSEEIIVMKGDAPGSVNNHYSIYLQADGTLIGRSQIGGGDYSVATSTAPDPFNWHHAVLTLDRDGNLVLYLDGTAVGTTDISAGSASNLGNVDSLIVGTQGDGTLPFTGDVDELGIWSAALTADEIFTIYSRQKTHFSGIYESEVIDSGVSGANWTNLSWVTTLPNSKELPGSTGSESSEDYADLVGSTSSTSDNDLMDGILGVWHLNESSWTTTAEEVLDSSGNGNHGTATASATTTSAGILSRAGVFDGASVVTLPASSTFVGTANQTLTLAAWFNTETIGAGANDNRILTIHDGNPNSGITLSVGSSSKVSFDVNGVGTTESADDISFGKWTHVAVTYDGNCFQLYVDGDADGSCATGSLPVGSSEPAVIGGLDSSSNYFEGKIDEVAIWNRALTASEIGQLYTRAGNQVSYQVRACDDAACDTESWVGPDNTPYTWFSEIFNNALINSSAVPSGDVNLTSPDLSFEDFSEAGLNLTQNPYFQYRILMGSDDLKELCNSSPCHPQLSEVKVETSGNYYDGSPSIVNTLGSAFTFLRGFSVQYEGDCSLSFQISNDGTTFYFWNGATWTSASESSDSNTESVLDANISSFPSTIGSGTFYFKAFLNSDNTQSCTLKSVTVDRGDPS